MSRLQRFIEELPRVHPTVMSWTPPPATLESMKVNQPATARAGPEKGRHMEPRATALLRWIGWIAGIGLAWTAAA
jgi:hypothetical protein